MHSHIQTPTDRVLGSEAFWWWIDQNRALQAMCAQLKYAFQLPEHPSSHTEALRITGYRLRPNFSTMFQKHQVAHLPLAKTVVLYATNVLQAIDLPAVWHPFIP